MPLDYSLYLIADPLVCAPIPLLDAVEAVMDAGITCVQLRMKHQSLEKVLITSKRLLSLLKPRGIPLIINDYLPIAQMFYIAGIHIGQTDQTYITARKQLGYKKVIGLSIETIEQAEECRSFACDYFGIGPVFPTSTKQDAAPPMGIEKLKQIRSLLSPKITVAIGGIQESNLQAVLATGVSGVAIAAGIFSSLTPKKTTQTLSHTISFFKKIC